jgi:hypothetical protein
MAKKIQWHKPARHSRYALPIIAAVFGLGLYVGATGGVIFLGDTLSTDDMTAASWRWHKNNRHTTFSLAPVVDATTTPKLPTKQPKNNPTPQPTPIPKPGTTTTTTPKPTPTPTPIPTPQPTPTPAPVGNSNEKSFTAYITAYTYWDNTPPGSSDISNPIIHQKAGGTGTFADPITLAVGHDMHTGSDVLDYPAGTKFYLPYLKKYFIAEDTCGDGNHPENGPCHSGYQGHPWLDLWIDGANGTSASTNRCAEDLTELHTIIQNPASNYAVVVGSVYNNSCATQFSDTPNTI